MAKIKGSHQFAPILSTKINVKSIKLDVLRPWVVEKITDILGFDDEVVIEYAMSLIEADSDGQDMQIKLTGFLEDKTPAFMAALWPLLISAQTSKFGIPQSFLDAEQQKFKAQRAAEMLEKERNGEKSESFVDSDRNPSHSYGESRRGQYSRRDGGRHSYASSSRSRADRGEDDGANEVDRRHSISRKSDDMRSSGSFHPDREARLSGNFDKTYSRSRSRSPPRRRNGFEGKSENPSTGREPVISVTHRSQPSAVEKVEAADMESASYRSRLEADKLLDQEGW